MAEGNESAKKLPEDFEKIDINAKAGDNGAQDADFMEIKGRRWNTSAVVNKHDDDKTKEARAQRFIRGYYGGGDDKCTADDICEAITEIGKAKTACANPFTVTAQTVDKALQSLHYKKMLRCYNGKIYRLVQQLPDELGEQQSQTTKDIVQHIRNKYRVGCKFTVDDVIFSIDKSIDRSCWEDAMKFLTGGNSEKTKYLQVVSGLIYILRR